MKLPTTLRPYFMLWTELHTFVCTIFNIYLCSHFYRQENSVREFSPLLINELLNTTSGIQFISFDLQVSALLFCIILCLNEFLKCVLFQHECKVTSINIYKFSCSSHGHPFSYSSNICWPSKPCARYCIYNHALVKFIDRH